MKNDDLRCPDCGIVPGDLLDKATRAMSGMKYVTADVRVSWQRVKAQVERHDAECGKESPVNG